MESTEEGVLLTIISPTFPLRILMIRLAIGVIA
jgi:hypothetical protein